MKKTTMTYSNDRLHIKGFDAQVPSFANVFSIKDSDNYPITNTLDVDTEWVPDGKNKSYIRYSLLFSESKKYSYDVTIYIYDLSEIEIWFTKHISWNSKVKYRVSNIEINLHSKIKIRNPEKYQNLFILHNKISDEINDRKDEINHLLSDHYNLIENKFKKFKETVESIKHNCEKFS